MGSRADRRRVTAAMEAESREWLVRCPACGHAPSVWELGGVRYRARGTKKQFRRCPACRQFGWHTVYRVRDGVRLPPLRRARPLGWHVGAFAALLLLGVGLLGGGLFLILGVASAGPRDAVTGYCAAVSARDWAGAHGHLSAAQRGRVSPADLAALWAAREGAHGPPANCRVTNFSVKNGTARVTVTLRYRDGATERRTVRLVKEGDSWVLAADF